MIMNANAQSKYLTAGRLHVEASKDKRVSDRGLDQMAEAIYHFQMELRLKFGYGWPHVMARAGVLALAGGRDYSNAQGRFSTRLARGWRDSAFYNPKRDKFTPALLTQIGNVAANYLEALGDWEFAIEGGRAIGKMRPGRFGDEDSCFYASNEHMREAMANDGGERFRVVKFWDVDGNPSGRTWAYYDAADDALAMFNSYGLPDGLRMKAEIVARGLGLAAREVGLVSEGGLHLNSGDKWAVGGEEGEYRFYLECPPPYVCENCGEGVDEDDLQFPDGYDVGPFCERCYQELFRHCGFGEHDVTADMAMYEIGDGRRRGEDVCAECVRTGGVFTVCPGCDLAFQDDNYLCFECENCAGCCECEEAESDGAGDGEND